MTAKKGYRVDIDFLTTLDIEATCEDEARDLARVGWHHSFEGVPVECEFERVEASAIIESPE